MQRWRRLFVAFAVLLALGGSALANVQWVQFNPSPSMPGDDIFATVNGYWPDPCYHDLTTFQFHAGDTIVLTTNVVYEGSPCVPVIVPWEVTFELGTYSGGLHYLRWTESVASSFTGDTTEYSWTYPFLVGSCDPCFTGDLGLDGSLTVSDLTRLVAYLFNGEALPCPDNRANIDGSPDGVNVADLVYFVAYLFEGGPAPVECGP